MDKMVFAAISRNELVVQFLYLRNWVSRPVFMGEFCFAQKRVKLNDGAQ